MKSTNWKEFPWDPPIQAMLEYAQKLTCKPWEVQKEDIERLRSHGLDDPFIHDLCQVIGYFNYINRIAEGLGVGKPS